MTDLGDLDLNKPVGTLESDDRPRRWRAAAIIVVLIGLVAAGWWFLGRRQAPSTSGVRVHTEQQVVPAPPRPEAVAGDNIELAPLAETDPIVRQLVGQLSSHPRVAAWLATDQLIRNFAVVTVNVAGGRSPAKLLSRVRPAGAFSVRDQGATLTIDPRSYRRYDDYGDAVAGLDALGTAKLYATLKPRIQEAYRELGYPDGDFDTALERAFIELLNTPVVEGDVIVAPKSVSYEYADPKLQSLSAAQRQFLRMGPRNVRLVQAKLREIAPLVGMDLK